MNERDRFDDNVVDLLEHPCFRKPSLRIDDQLLKCVVFLGLPQKGKKKGELNPEWTATAFFVDVLSSDEKVTTVYLVTSKHNVDKIAGREFVIGLNVREDLGIGLVRVPAGTKWWLHPETPNEVDVAVVPWMPPVELDVKSLRVQEWFLNEQTIQQQQIGPGDEVFSVGLFTKMSGQTKLLPIVRTGNIAMMPNEKIPGIKIGEKWTGDVEAYLIEARSIGGFSGSPVFVRETVFNKTTDKDTGKITSVFHGMGFHYFLGIVNGHWEIRASQRNDTRIKAVPRGFYDDQVNLGIAVVIPCKKIVEILNHPELVERRKKGEQGPPSVTVEDLGNFYSKLRS